MSIDEPAGATPLDVHLENGAFAKMLGGAIALLCLAVSVFATVPSSFLKWTATALLGWLGVQVLVTAFAKNASGAVLRIDRQGIRHAILGAVRWQDVGGIAVDWSGARRGRGPFLVLGLVPGAIASEAWTIPGALNASDRIQISLRDLDCTPAQIYQHATALRDLIEPPRLKSWDPGMSQEVLAAALARERDLSRMHSRLEPGSAAASDPVDQSGFVASSRALRRAMDKDAARDRNWLAWLAWVSLIASGLGLAARLMRHWPH